MDKLIFYHIISGRRACRIARRPDGAQLELRPLVVVAPPACISIA